MIWILFSSPFVRADSLEQAQALLLKKDRQGACALVQKALDGTPLAAKAARQRLNDGLHQMSTVFLSDKGQKLFESGQSLLFENPEMAGKQLRDALELEDQNILVLANLAKLSLFKGDCEAGKAHAEAARKVNRSAADPALLEMRALLCLKNSTEFRERSKQFLQMDRWQESFLGFLSGQEQLVSQNAKRAAELLSKVVEEQPQFPESYWWMSRAAKETGREPTEWLEKYVALCKGVTTKERRKFSLEPKLCQNLKEAQDELARDRTEI